MTSVTLFNPFTPAKMILKDHLETMGYTVFIDSLHKDDQEWIDAKENASSKSSAYDAVFFKILDNVVITYDSPDILLEVTDDTKKEYYDYSTFEKWFDDLLLGNVYKLTPVPEVKVISLPRPEPIIQNQDYELRYQLLNDTMVYEVIKPNTDRSYTTIVNGFKKNGHVKFFTNLFACKSWGVYNQDIAFLKQCWKHLNMPGDFDLDKLLKDTKYDVPPKVWRSTLEHVLEIQNKLNGFYFFSFLCTTNL